MKRFSIAAAIAVLIIPATYGATEYESRLEQLGGVSNDLSTAGKIKLDEPECAYVNFTGFSRMPEAKGVDYKGWIEFYDGEGNYFRKHIIANAQGNSSLGFVKKNVAVDITDDEWEGDETPDITFGEWVKQDSFHLKAYYTDWFRGGAPVGAYKVFDMTTADRGELRYPWQRAGVEGADAKARCHPDGFPCAVYLNGEFYGMFSWQLKKHRRNMGMDKSAATHIHLDGDINTVTLFREEGIDWTKFEVRNPKTLYTMDGTKYDGDDPRELIDETSGAYDANNEGHRLTAEVKRHIVALSRYCMALDRIRRSGASQSKMREEISKRFDTQGMIDYLVFSAVVNNVDGWWKNWQWFTYDGEKWYVEPYDLDMTFGGLSSGYYVTLPEYNWYYSDPLEPFYLPIGPFSYIYDYYMDDVKERYRELRDNGVYTAENILGPIMRWVERVGEENYAADSERWPDAFYNRPLIVGDGWEEVKLYRGFNGIPEYQRGRTYRKGAQVRRNWRVFKATDTTNADPIAQQGYTDGPDRIRAWVERRLELEDSLWLGRDPDTGVERVEETPRPGSGRIYDLQGRQHKELQPGVNIVDGRKVVK